MRHVYAARTAAVLRAVVFFATMQWLVMPMLVAPLLHGVGRRFGYVNDFTAHVFSAPRVLIQDMLVVVLVMIVTALLILTERRPAGENFLTAVARRSTLSDGRPWIARCVVGCIAGPLLLSCVLGILAAAGMMRASVQDVSLTDFVRHQAVLIPTFAAAGLAEELLNRGYVLRALTDGLGFGAAALFTSACFAWVHYAEGDTLIGSFGVLEFAIFSCLAIRTTGTLAFSIGFHAAWDYAESAIYGVPDSSFTFAGAFARSAFRGPVALTGGDAGPEASLLLLAAMAGMIFVLLTQPASRAG